MNLVKILFLFVFLVAYFCGTEKPKTLIADEKGGNLTLSPNSNYYKNDTLLRQNIGNCLPEIGYLKNLEGNTLDYNQLTGNNVLILFWNVNCNISFQACKEVSRKDSIFNGVKTVLIECSYPNNQIEDRIRVLSLKNPLLGETFFVGKSGMLLYTLNITGYPTVFILNKKGVIVYAQAGLFIEEITKALQALKN